MVEAGDVDWANHANNLDSSIGAVVSGDLAVKAVFDWIDARKQWDRTAVIVTADHGHYFNLKDPRSHRGGRCGNTQAESRSGRQGEGRIEVVFSVDGPGERPGTSTNPKIRHKFKTI